MKLQAGFARVDITPPFGTLLDGYFFERPADGVLDPLQATAIAFDDGEKKAVLINLDDLGTAQPLMMRFRQAVAERVGTVPEGVFIECTHTHLGPRTMDNLGYSFNHEHVEWMVVRIADVAELAMQDLKPVTYMGYTRGIVEGVSFVRRYRMKDGSIETNPGRLNPNIVEPVSPPDTQSQLLVIERENAKEIGIVNFQVHPDVIGGSKISADYPGFVRRTYEKLVENSLCVYINGAQGDSNHIDTTIPKPINSGYKWARYMGVKIAASVASKRDLLEELPIGKINFGQKNIFVTLNKGRPEQMEEAARLYKVFLEEGRDAAKELAKTMKTVSGYVEAKRIMGLEPMPPEKELYLTALSVGEWVVAGFPGEPFTDIGRAVKAESKFTLTMPSCCSNGYEGYFPMSSCFDEGGYEVSTARFIKGTAEKVIEGSVELINSLK